MNNLTTVVTPILADVGDAIGYMQSQEFLNWLNALIGGYLSQIVNTIISAGFGLLFSAPGVVFEFLADQFLNGNAG